jgi:hypothetical protein
MPYKRPFITLRGLLLHRVSSANQTVSFLICILIPLAAPPPGTPLLAVTQPSRDGRE